MSAEHPSRTNQQEIEMYTTVGYEAEVKYRRQQIQKDLGKRQQAAAARQTRRNRTR
jgi:hypothetical protein